MFRECLSLFFIIIAISPCVDNYRILGVFTMQAHSHFYLGSSLMKALAEAGHDVTIIAPFNEKEPPSLSTNGSYREIILTGITGIHKSMAKDGKIDILRIREAMKNPINALNMLSATVGQLAEEVLKHPEVKKLLNSNEKFDVVILSEFMNKILRGLAHHFDASLILFANSGIISWYNDEIGKILLPSIAPIGIQNTFHMTFSERLQNTIYKIQSIKWHQNYAKQQNELLRKYFHNSPSMEDISKNISLVLINAHPSTETPQPLLPNTINIGGFHIKPPKKLPQDLQQIMDNAKNGVILFSFGTVVDPTVIPPEKIKEALRVLGKRKETILWKFGEELSEIPKNVIVRKWLPQQDILAHPNVKLFITHSGYLSTIETTYHGVPTVSVPFAADQASNARFVSETGSGVVIDLENFGGTAVENAIEEVIGNPKYREAAKLKSRILRDRQNKPIDDAIFWVEYVIRHKGAKHLRVPYLDMPLYQIYMADVIAVIFASAIIAVLILAIVIKTLYNCIKKRGSRNTKSDQVSNKKNK